MIQQDNDILSPNQRVVSQFFPLVTERHKKRQDDKRLHEEFHFSERRNILRGKNSLLSLSTNFHLRS